MTVRDKKEHLVDIYGAFVSRKTISNMTDRVMPLVTEWRNRPLMEVYPIVYIDGIRYKVRDNGRIKRRATDLASLCRPPPLQMRLWGCRY